METQTCESDCQGLTTIKRINMGLLPILIIGIVIVIRISFVLCKTYRQKTRNQPQRRMYRGSRTRSSLSQAEPSIYVSPANYPPPPKYEAMAPPSYEEVVGIHYPNYQSGQFQPIVTPLATALAQNPTRADGSTAANNTDAVQSSGSSVTSSGSSVPSSGSSVPEETASPPAVVTITNEQNTVAAAS